MMANFVYRTSYLVVLTAARRSLGKPCLFKTKERRGFNYIIGNYVVLFIFLPQKKGQTIVIPLLLIAFSPELKHSLLFYDLCFKRKHCTDLIFISTLANAGVTSDAESITESLRRSRQLMVQEVERSTNTLVAFDESTGVLKKAESEYKGHRSLLSRTRNLLSTMQRQDVIDRVILIIGFSLFVCAVLYVVSKRIGILKLQQMATAAIKAQLAGKAANGDAMPIGQEFDGGNTVPNVVDIPLQQRLHDEL
ncbi:hypothetical protein F2Q68_00034715 [Brassica cretica]|uniref:Sec20 C-terminal domain-containing protein n=1 Tax=Brassica cretica TaxID=69181 RepID=A0A8S9H435_BRACR|nr:hypothetical protein F2Q68_00034715 [Brassica cretica]